MSRNNASAAHTAGIPATVTTFENALIGLLIAKPAEVENQTALFYQNVDQFLRLINTPIFDGSVLPLHLATNHLNVTLTRILLSLGANVDAVDELGNTALYCSLAKAIQAAKFSNEDDASLIEILGDCDLASLKSGIRINAQKGIEVISELLSSGANPTIANLHGQSAVSASLANPTFEASSIIIAYTTEARDAQAVLEHAVPVDAATTHDPEALQAHISYLMENGREAEAFELIGQLEG